MSHKNKVFIACSLDGYIADKDGSIDWLHMLPNPDNIDMGYGDFMQQIDAIVMGRVTFDTVCSFDIDWPYTKPVFVLSNSMTEVPKKLLGKVHLLKGEITHVVETIHSKGYQNLYIDGGTTIQNFLKENLVDEMIITTIPILLGGGFSLFSDLDEPVNFDLKNSHVFLGNVVQNHYVKKL